jgi:hypothetical protein
MVPVRNAMPVRAVVRELTASRSAGKGRRSTNRHDVTPGR